MRSDAQKPFNGSQRPQFSASVRFGCITWENLNSRKLLNIYAAQKRETQNYRPLVFHFHSVNISFPLWFPRECVNTPSKPTRHSFCVSLLDSPFPIIHSYTAQHQRHRLSLAGSDITCAKCRLRRLLALPLTAVAPLCPRRKPHREDGWLSPRCYLKSSEPKREPWMWTK